MRRFLRDPAVAFGSGIPQPEREDGCIEVEELDNEVQETASDVEPMIRASERKFSRGYEGRYRAPKFYWPPQALLGAMPLNHFLSDGCRSSFKSEEITVFAYS